MIITLVLEKNANFCAENCRKSQKIVIITSTPVNRFGFMTFGKNFVVHKCGQNLLTIIAPDLYVY
jgi:hypothetical protein